MKLNLLLSVLAAVIFTSCSTAYKTGQTPDDVYYSPVTEKETVVKKERNRAEEYIIDPEQRQIRMQAFDPRWRGLDDRYNYGSLYTPYSFAYNHDYYYNPFFYNYPVFNNSFWALNNNSFWGMNNNFYGPGYNNYFMPGFTLINQRNSAPRMTNLSSYNSSKKLSTFNPKSGSTSDDNTYRRYNNRNSDDNDRRAIRPSDNYNNSNNNNTRTYSPPSSSPSSPAGSSGNSGGTPVQRNGRGQ